MPYEKGVMKLRGGNGGQVELVSEKVVVIDGRKKEEICFASALVQKGYVGFYFMPIYRNTRMKELLQPELLSCLKGKACFHIKRSDTVLFSQIKEALQIGYEKYNQFAWI